MITILNLSTRIIVSDSVRMRKIYVRKWNVAPKNIAELLNPQKKKFFLIEKVPVMAAKIKNENLC